MRISSTMPATGEALRMPKMLATDATIGGLNPSSLRLALVLTSMAFFGPEGQWTINKRDLEIRTDVVLDNAARLIEPLREAMLELDQSHVRLFDVIDYEPGTRWKTAGTITARLSVGARNLLYSNQETIKLPVDEFRRYASISGIILRMRLAGRMQSTKTAKFDQWQLKADDFAKTSVFGSYGASAMIKRTNAAGEIVEYVSLSRAEDKLLRKGVEEINVRSKGVRVEIKAFRNSAEPKSRLSEIYIETRRLHDAKPPQKPSLSDLNRRSKIPAITR